MLPNKSAIQVSPNLLKNFDPFAILEPQKSNVNGTKDLDGSSANLDICLSFLEQKPHYDLVDLFQNFYVTPQQVKLKNLGSDINIEKPNSSTDEKCDPFEILDYRQCHENGPRVETLIDLGGINEIPSTYDSIDFKIFCDKIESGEKVDWSKDTKENNKSQADFDEPNQISSSPKADEDDIDPDQMIDELLRQKSIEKRLLEDMTSEIDKNSSVHLQNNFGIVDLTKLKVLSSPVDLEALKNDKSDTSNNMHKNITKKCSEHKTTENDVTTEIPHFKLNNNCLNDCNSIKNNCNIKIDGQINNAVNFKVIPIKKDEKVYKKKHIMKPEHLTRNYTKGADLEEKNIVLPLIMNRILTRKAHIEKQKSLKRVLILDDRKKESITYDYGSSGSNQVKNDAISIGDTSNIEKVTAIDTKHCCNCNCSSKPPIKHVDSLDPPFGEVNPIIVMEDCRKERLKALRKSQEFLEFVLGGKRK